MNRAGLALLVAALSLGALGTEQAAEARSHFSISFGQTWGGQWRPAPVYTPPPCPPPVRVHCPPPRYFPRPVYFPPHPYTSYRAFRPLRPWNRPATRWAGGVVYRRGYSPGLHGSQGSRPHDPRRQPSWRGW